MRIIRSFIFVIMAMILPLSAAHAEWREATSANFVVVSGGSERELIRMSQRLEAVHWMLGLVTGVQPEGPSQKVRIYLVDNIAQVRRGIGVDSRSDVAGYYMPNIAGAIAVVPRNEGDFSTTILFHEYAHHYMLQYMPQTFPSWLVEGFAEFASTASLRGQNGLEIGAFARHRANELQYGRWVPTSRMFAPRSSEDREAGVASYGQYWIATHYLLLNAERRPQLQAFINAINRGRSVTEAYGAFAGGLDRLDGEIRRYAQAQSVPSRLAQLPPEVMATPSVRIMRPGEAALIETELQAQRRLDDEERTTLAAQMAAVVDRFPDDPTVRLLEARVAFQNEDWAAAEAAADRVLAVDAANVRANAYKGWAMLKRLDADGGATDEQVRTARAFIVRANRAAPDDAIPLMAYFESFALAGESAPPAAIEGLVRASILVPQVDSVRMSAAMALLAQRDLPRARRTLLPLAYAPHASSQQSFALQLVGWIDRGAEGGVPTYVDVPITEIAAED
jgi:hypothetical protein